VLKKAEGVEDLIAMVAVPGRRTHAVEDERISFFGMVCGAVGVLHGVEFEIVCATTVQLGERGA